MKEDIAEFMRKTVPSPQRQIAWMNNVILKNLRELDNEMANCVSYEQRMEISKRKNGVENSLSKKLNEFYRAYVERFPLKRAGVADLDFKLKLFFCQEAIDAWNAYQFGRSYGVYDEPKIGL